MLNLKTSLFTLTLGAALLAPTLVSADGICAHDAADHCQTVVATVVTPTASPTPGKGGQVLAATPAPAAVTTAKTLPATGAGTTGIALAVAAAAAAGAYQMAKRRSQI